MEIKVAKSAGFCFGVSRAVSLAEEKAEEGRVYTFGPIIHNEFEIKRLFGLGVVPVNDVNEIHEGDRVIVRSHGVGEETENKLVARGAEVFDATCPFVKKIHNIVSEYTGKGYTAVIFGNEGHPEVSGIAGRCRGTALTVAGEEDAVRISAENEHICLVAQTTANKEDYKKIIKIIKNTCKDTVFFDTICNATMIRQKEAEELSEQCSAMIVIGDRKSRNTNKLCEVASRHCKNVFLAESADEVRGMALSGITGVTAGASAPDWIIKEVLKTMEENKTNTELSFAEEFEKSLTTLNTGDVVKGTVISITPTEVNVDLGFKYDGVINASELTDDPTLKPEDIVHVGDTVEAFVYRVSDVEGTVGLSVKKLKSIKGWDEIQKAFEEKKDVTGKIIEAVSGGVIAIADGCRIFIPASQANDRYLADLSVLVGKELPIRIRDINKGRRKVLGSVKDVLLEEKEKLSKAFWDKVDAGEKEFKGTVKTLTTFGAFVDLGGVDGLIHISELSWNHVKHPSDILKVGDEVTVRLVDANKETGKISLGYRKAEDNPWVIAQSKLHVNDVIKAKVVRLVSFGAFVEIIPGVDGLIHISQIANKRIDKPSDELSVGQEVEALITDINWDTQKIALSIRALLPDEAPAAAEEEAKEPANEAAEEPAEAAAEETTEESAEAAAEETVSEE